MTTVFDIEDTLSNRLAYWMLAAFLILLPFDYFYSQLALVAFALHTLIHLKKENVKRLASAPVLVPVSFFLLGLLGMLYSPDLEEAGNVATRQLAILLFPCLLALSNLHLKRYGNRLLLIFAFTCTATVVYLFADALFTLHFFRLSPRLLFSPAFMNHNFSSPIDMHATYLSVYVAFSICIFFRQVFMQANAMKYFYIGCIVILLAGMLQLSSRAGFTGLLVVLTIAVPFMLPTFKKRLIFMLTSLTLSFCLIGLIWNSNAFKERYVNELRSDLSTNAKEIEGMEPRVERWIASVELVKHSPVVGHGSGSEKQLLKDMYFEKKMYSAYVNEFNAHNQYLAILINTGIIGLLVFLSILVFGFRKAIADRDVLFTCFLILLLIVCISENFLELNKGIFFYSFFFSFFMAGKTGKR